ncbi:MAG: M23 family metallopeptidase [Pseudomonadota bacterium]
MPAFAFVVGLWAFTDVPDRALAALRVASDVDQVLVQVEGAIDIAPTVDGAAFLNLPGDPTLLRLPDEDLGDRVRRVPGPGVLNVRRFGLPSPDRIAILRDELVVTESRLITALPSSREDFAFFQAQQDRAAQEMRQIASNPQALMSLTDPKIAEADVDDEDSYGAVIEGVGGEDVAAEPVEVEETSLAFTRREAERRPLYEDIILRAEVARDLSDLLSESPLDRRAAALATRIAATIPGADRVARGSLVALRLRSDGGRKELAQVSVYGPDEYLGSVAQLRSGEIVSASDPWVGEGLAALTDPSTPNADESFRLLDAVYSAALRGGVPSDLAGTFTGLLARSFDLERAADQGDRITLAFAPDPGPGGSAEGQLMYAALQGPSGNWRCYVIPNPGDGGFRCHVPGRQKQGNAAIVTPVSGVLTSGFGPRNHPILKTVRLHAGVDWAAPTGTPVRAAAAGRVTRAGVAGGYGNLVSLAHAGGLETRYAHLNRFAPGLAVGDPVEAGQIIGEVGTTGRSTGPHLHFETRLAGEPVDPMPLLSGETVVASGAVEALVAQIIQVESAGNARAKNPLSTATGLGQFIESTWLRMMRTYRPDLIATLSRAELLRLRFDPTLSRDMVTKLAQENEDFLRRRNHAITPGRLYLAHFLGPGGAHTVLSASEDRTIREVMGAGVVRANPFLRNYDVADLKAWADRKMGRVQAGAVPVVAAPPEPLDPATALFIDLVDQVVAEPS